MTRYLTYLAVAVCAACGPGNTLDEMPPEVRGKWVTGSAEYAGRSFSIGARQLLISTDGRTQTQHPVTRIEVQEINGRPHYALYHRNRDGVDDVFRIEYATYPSEFIRLVNVNHVHWVRPETLEAPDVTQ